MKYRSMFPWMWLDMLFFVLLNWVLIIIVHPRFELLGAITPMRLLILGLAVYRAANIVSNEFVTTPLRARFVRTVERDGVEVEEPYEEGFRGFLGSLLYCPSCTGVWLATFLTYFYLWNAPAASIVILILALSGLERFFAYSFGKLKRK